LYNNLGLSYSLTGDYEEAIKTFKEALRNTTAHPKIYNNLGLVLSKVGRYQLALEAFRKGGDEAQALNNIGCIYLQRGERVKAIRAFEKAIESKPTYYIKAGENLKKAKMNHVYEQSFDPDWKPSDPDWKPFLGTDSGKG
jgi:tetratricopeptide (TPR) repeat protein